MTIGVDRKFFASLMIGLGLVLIGLFGLRLMQIVRHWNAPPRPEPLATTTDVSLIRDWMTIPYVAHTYAVPDRMLFEALGIPDRDKENRRKSLSELNEKYYPAQDGIVLKHIQAAILAFQKGVPLPPMPGIPVNGDSVPTP